MKKRLAYIVLAAVVACTLFTGCGKETTKEKETSTTIKEVNSSEKETGTSEIKDEVTSERETTTEMQTTTVKQEETTKKEEQTTSKKEQQTTTKKEQQTTTKKEQQTTTKKEEQTTTKKEQQTTTTKQEETTTKREEETTTQAPIPEEAKTWFESKGYTITAKNQVADLSLTTNPTHICNTTYEFAESECSWYVPAEGYKKVQFTRIAGSCCNADWVAFDRYTGVIIDYYLSPGEENENGYKEIVLNIDEREIKLYLTLSKGGWADTEILCPEDYDGIVFVWANDDDFVMKSGVEYFTKDYTLDEAYSYNVKDVYFLSVDDK